MHRVRQSLPYFRQFGWEAEIITVDLNYVESYSTDPLLLKTIPDDLPVHYVKAWPVNITRKLGLGSLSMRSYFQFKKKGNELLRSKKFDLVYFSTTAFHVMALGPYWKKKFKVPFVLDIQDPWRNDFYLSKPSSQRPPKFWISYNIDKKLEAATVPKADGIISVSEGYCTTFKERYPSMLHAKFAVIPFAGSSIDFEVMEQNIKSINAITFNNNKINIVYIGRGGHDLGFALSIFFSAIKLGVELHPGVFSKLHIWFAGTSYATAGKGTKTIEPVAAQYGLAHMVTEITDRLPYFETLFALKHANALFMPGSTDTSYTASKLYPYILAQKPLFVIFNEKSSVVKILNKTGGARVHTFQNTDELSEHTTKCMQEMLSWLQQVNVIPQYNKDAFEQYTAPAMTRLQTDFFNSCLKHEQN